MNDATSASRYGAAMDEKIDNIAGAIKQGARAGVTRAEDAMEQARHVAKAASDSAVAARDKLAASIEARPLTSVVIAFAVGAVIGRLLRR